jgi:hypothetical protein
MRLKAQDPRSKHTKRVPKMSAPTSTILWCRSGSEFSRVAADHVAALLARKPEAVIALPPLSMARWSTEHGQDEHNIESTMPMLPAQDSDARTAAKKRSSSAFTA